MPNYWKMIKKDMTPDIGHGRLSKRMGKFKA